MIRLIVFILFLAPSTFAQSAREVSYGPHPKQAFDVYLPPNAADAAVIVMLHGGGWRLGDKGNARVWENKSTHWLSQGAIFISVNTRLLPDANPVMQTEDLAQALGLIQANVANWGGDPDKIILMGHSAGAHVAALLATRQDLQRTAGLRPWRGTILLDSISMDIPTLMQAPPSRFHLSAFGNDPAFWRDASPSTYLSSDDGPFLIVCATDPAGRCAAMRRFAEDAATNGVAITILPVRLSHMQINAELGRPSAYTAAIDQWIAARLPP